MRVKVSTLVLAGGAALGLGVLAFVLFRGSPGPAAAQSDDPEGAKGSGARRARSLPRFSLPTASGDQSPQPAHQPPPPSFIKPEVAELKERASKDGYLYREVGSTEVFVVQGGTRYFIRSPQEFEALGYKWDQIEEVPRGSLGFLNDRPAERTLLRERDSPAVFIYENGQKRFIMPGVFERKGYDFKDVKVVPAGGLGRETPGAAIY